MRQRDFLDIADTSDLHSDPDNSTSYALGMATRQGESAAASHSPSTPDDVDSPGFILVQLVSTMLSSPISMSDLKGTHSYRQ